jgi:hypothetical protein
MTFHRFTSVFVVGLAVLAVMIGGLFSWNETTDTGALTLEAPAFVQAAAAAEESSDTAQTPQTLLEEAGMAAYFKTDLPITINNNLRNAFRVIEDETDTYIIGSVPLDGFSEKHDVHAYVHTDGWLLAYYPREDAASKMLDIVAFNGVDAIPNKLVSALGTVAGAAGVGSSPPSFYHFQYPNANRMTIVGETDVDGTWFEMTLPSNLTYFEFCYIFHEAGSSGGYSTTGSLSINGNVIDSVNNGFTWGTISASQMPTNQEIRFDQGGGTTIKYAIVIIYREP